MSEVINPSTFFLKTLSVITFITIMNVENEFLI